MTGIIAALIILTALLLILVVLVQNSKGGGLSSTFAASNQVMGVRKTADFLEKATWTLVGVLVALCLLSTAAHSSVEDASTESISKEKAESSGTTAKPVTPSAAPSTPAPGGTTPP